MKSICETTYFPKVALDYLARATRIVEEIPIAFEPVIGEELRCHEVARVVGTILELKVLDGAYAAVDHSWCMIEGPGHRGKKLILDSYSVGRLPQVQLVDFYVNPLYRPKESRTDIRESVVSDLLFYLSKCGIRG